MFIAGPLHSECLSVWTEYVARAVEIAERIKGFRHIWINGQNRFDIDLAALKELHFPSGKTDPSEKVHRTIPPVPDSAVEHVPSKLVCNYIYIYIYIIFNNINVIMIVIIIILKDRHSN